MQKLRPGNIRFTACAMIATSSSSELTAATCRPTSRSICSTRCWRAGAASSAPLLEGASRPVHSRKAAFTAKSRSSQSHTAAGRSNASKKDRNAAGSSSSAGGGRRESSLFMRRRLFQIQDPRRADVGFGLETGDLSDLPDDLRHPLRFAIDDVDRAPGEILLLEAALEQLRITHDRGERLIELVRGGAGQGDDKCVALRFLQLLLRAGELLLQLHPLTEIREDAHRGDLALPLEDDGGGHVHRHALALLVDHLLPRERELPARIVPQLFHHLAGDAGRIERLDVKVRLGVLGAVAEDRLRSLVEE